ncbi:putative UV damage endonuclease [Fictibacillus macauensis ZFHKF-1]|uniref:Putative UV damage endonuclease n=1 Tax=Fictibacillus macauensis ZFHKF-1 TaxID=1196324 RepID=I8UKJ5_9BACL|nr:UV DNA damage repair endonuclease UvsE [Fictibacillus macauensis]EIT87405.1 putative UV damage endonuclease [Fictibacillus macauensis ZFHKF-1]
MTFVRLGYVAMSMELKNASPSQTMTYARFSQIEDQAAAIRKLERIALSNIENMYRLLRHNAAHDIHFYRMTSRLIPLANHPDLLGWQYLKPLRPLLQEVGEFARKHKMRLDFHPDHFVLLNSPKHEVFRNAVETLKLHYRLLKAMKIPTAHRCVLHVGGQYKETEAALERFVENWMDVPAPIQQMIMLENDDTSFTLEDTLFLCEKLGIPCVFDYHHHLAYHKDSNWQQHWERVVTSWKYASLPLKIHISSPKSEQAFRHHADFVDCRMFFDFLREVKGTVSQIDCMIEAKQKDRALFKLMKEIRSRKDIEMVDGSSFYVRD